MARSVNKVILVGNLGRDAETKFTPSGIPVSRFSVATSRRWKDQATGEWKDETDWTNVSVWRQENLANYLTKGKQVYVEGRLQTRSYEDKEGQKRYVTEVIADEVILLGGRGGDAAGGGGGGAMDEFEPAPRGGGGPVSMPRSAARPASAARPQASSGPADSGEISDDDVPF